MVLTGTYQVGLLDTLWPIAFVLLVSTLFYIFRNTIRQSPLKKWIPILMLSLMILYDAKFIVNILMIFNQNILVTMQELPLHLCASSSVLVILYLSFRKEIFLDALILQGIIGALVTFIFPSVTDSPTTYEYYRFFFAHTLLFIVPMYAIIVEGKRVGKRNLVIGFITLHIVGVLALIVNLIFGTHYMYINADITTNMYSFLPVNELFPIVNNYPLVIIVGELIAIPVYFIFYFSLKRFQGILDNK